MKNFNEIPDLILEIWQEYSFYRAEWEMLTESRKSLLAKLASEQDWSEATRERIARCHPDYRKHLANTRENRKKMLNLKIEMDSLLILWPWSYMG